MRNEIFHDNDDIYHGWPLAEEIETLPSTEISESPPTLENSTNTNTIPSTSINNFITHNNSQRYEWSLINQFQKLSSIIISWNRITLMVLTSIISIIHIIARCIISIIQLPHLPIRQLHQVSIFLLILHRVYDIFYMIISYIILASSPSSSSTTTTATATHDEAVLLNNVKTMEKQQDPIISIMVPIAVISILVVIMMILFLCACLCLYFFQTWTMARRRTRGTGQRVASTVETEVWTRNVPIRPNISPSHINESDITTTTTSSDSISTSILSADVHTNSHVNDNNHQEDSNSIISPLSMSMPTSSSSPTITMGISLLSLFLLQIILPWACLGIGIYSTYQIYCGHERPPSSSSYPTIIHNDHHNDVDDDGMTLNSSNGLFCTWMMVSSGLLISIFGTRLVREGLYQQLQDYE